MFPHLFILESVESFNCDVHLSAKNHHTVNLQNLIILMLGDQLLFLKFLVENGLFLLWMNIFGLHGFTWWKTNLRCFNWSGTFLIWLKLSLEDQLNAQIMERNMWIPKSVQEALKPEKWVQAMNENHTWWPKGFVS